MSYRVDTLDADIIVDPRLVDGGVAPEDLVESLRDDGIECHATDAYYGRPLVRIDYLEYSMYFTAIQRLGELSPAVLDGSWIALCGEDNGAWALAWSSGTMRELGVSGSQIARAALDDAPGMPGVSSPRRLDEIGADHEER